MCCTCWMTFLLWFHHLMMFKKWGRNSWGYFWTLGVPLSEKKYRKGIPWDKIRLMEHGNKNCLNSFKKRKSCTKKEMLSLLRHLNFACRVVLPGRSFISHLIVLSTTEEPLHLNVHFDSMCRDDLAMCSDFLKSWNVVSFLSNIMWKKLRNPYILRGFLSK